MHNSTIQHDHSFLRYKSQYLKQQGHRDIAQKWF